MRLIKYCTYSRQAAFGSNLRFHSVASEQLKPLDSKKLLMRLRKESGFPFAKCKAALDEANYVISEAHILLQKWAKEDSNLLMNKLAARSAKEGLLSVFARGSQAALLEVNCETDFVSKNDLFQKLAQDSVRSVFESDTFRNSSYVANSSDELSTTRGEERFQNIDISKLESIASLKSEVLPLLKENIVFGRCRKIAYDKDVLVFTSVHPVLKSSENSYGKFVSIVAIKPKSANIDTEIIHPFGRQLAYHVIGMDPQTLYPEELDTEDKQTESIQTPCKESNESAPDSEANDEDVILEDQMISDNQTPFDKLSNALIDQNFLFEPEKTVGQLCDEFGIELIDFHRFELK